MNEKIVITADGYDRIDGRNAYYSDIKRLIVKKLIGKEEIRWIVQKLVS
ncbi:hypothetical protein [Anaerocolumna sp. MB42-C2]|nr:hypothetical protein [Anaerocolumna sp. MB42-C2]WMJ90795.1 hypothetical protein RBU59_20620 [Anaerocolumna sp. MB42-C2]